MALMPSYSGLVNLMVKKEIRSLEKSRVLKPKSQLNIPEDWNLQQHMSLSLGLIYALVYDVIHSENCGLFVSVCASKSGGL